MQCRSCKESFLSFKVTRPRMTSPQRWAWRSAPFSSNSPLLPLLTRSDDCLFPGAWNGGGGHAAGPGRLNPARKSKKRLNEAFQTRSCQRQLKTSRWSTDARPHRLHRINRARVGGEDVLTLLRKDNGWTLWLAKGRRCVVG